MLKKDIELKLRGAEIKVYDVAYGAVDNAHEGLRRKPGNTIDIFINDCLSANPK